MLFSEPKIPQSSTSGGSPSTPRRFSALQRAENSSIRRLNRSLARLAESFSALQRAENSSILCERERLAFEASFSALQRAENSSIRQIPRNGRDTVPFQCSSASRKFHNYKALRLQSLALEFQCSSASRKFLNAAGLSAARRRAAFQCSSASRKFLNRPRDARLRG